MYKTAQFSHSSHFSAYIEYTEWLAAIQQRTEIEIVSVVTMGVMIMVTYKTV